MNTGIHAQMFTVDKDVDIFHGHAGSGFGLRLLIRQRINFTPQLIGDLVAQTQRLVVISGAACMAVADPMDSPWTPQIAFLGKNCLT